MTTTIVDNTMLAGSNTSFRFRLVVSATLCLLLAVPAMAYRDGISGRTQIGCGGTGCHGSQPSQQTIVTLDGNRTVDPNTVNAFTLSVRHSSQAAAGFNLAAFDMQGQPAGMLRYPTSENAYVRILNGELTHRERRTMSGTPLTARWQIEWRSPSQPGKYIIRAVGNATNRDGAASPADEWNFLTPVTITVRGLVIDSPTQTATYCAGDTITFQWTSYGITSTSIAYSTDGGQSWRQFATVETREGANTYRYVLPTNLLATQQYRFRFISADNELIYTDTPDLTINPKTAIRTQPSVPSPQCEGGSVTLSLTAIGTNLTFRWHRDGVPIPGATSSQLVLSNLTISDAGSYTCIVTGACGTVTSNPVTLVVKRKPQIAAQSNDTIVAENSAIELYVSSPNDSGATYQWLKNGNPIPGATTARLTIAQATLRDSGVYVAEVANTCGSVQSQPIHVRITPTSSADGATAIPHRVYPNPVEEQIVVECPSPILTVELLDVTGRRVLKESSSLQYRHTIALDGSPSGRLGAGTYLLVIHTTAGTITQPILIVQR